MSFLRSNFIKLLSYLVLSFVLAALFTPFLFSWGKGLAAYAAENETVGFLEWLGEKAERGKFDRYFKRSLMLFALLLIWPLILWVKSGPKDDAKKEKAKRQKKEVWRDFGAGAVLAGGLFIILAVVAVMKGYFLPKDEVDWVKELSTVVGVAVVVALIEEYVFRGVLFDVCAKTMSVRATVFWSSMLFALVHFTQPPKGLVVSDPYAWYAGFEFLAQSMAVLFEAHNVVASFFCLFGVGLILAIARCKTGGLALSVGLHAGWILVYKGFTEGFYSNPDIEGSYIFGKSIREGLFPLAILLITLGLVMHYAKIVYGEKRDSELDEKSS